jgi:hypothetical protein
MSGSTRITGASAGRNRVFCVKIWHLLKYMWQHENALILVKILFQKKDFVGQTFFEVRN